jgi:uncharacterized protein
VAKKEFIYVVNRLHEMIPDISFELVTNGTLLDEEILNLIDSKKFYILLSLDGDEKMHDKYRGGFQNIKKWFPHLIKLKENYVVVQVGEVDNLYSNIEAIWKYGFKKVGINVLENYHYYDMKDISKFEKEYEKVIEAMLKGEGELICALDLVRAQEMSNYKKGCGATRGDITCDIWGRLYLCFRFVELGDDFVIGSIEKGIDKNREREMRTFIEKELNKNPYFYPDSDYCAVSLYQNNGCFDASPPPEWCEMIEIKHKLVAKYYYDLKKYIDETFSEGE